MKETSNPILWRRKIGFKTKIRLKNKEVVNFNLYSVLFIFKYIVTLTTSGDTLWCYRGAEKHKLSK